MLPAFLVAETKVRQSGEGEPLAIPEGTGSLFVTLGITHIVEQESLDVAIYGSTDGVVWSAKPLLAFSQKFYCGTYQMLLDLSAHQEIRFLRAKWHLNRWGRGNLTPMFGLYIFAETVEEHAPRSRVMAGSSR